MIAFGASALMLREARAKSSAVLWTSIIIGVLAARIGYVLTHLQHYAENPVEIIGLWDGGLSPVFGISATLLVAGWLSARRDVRPTRVVASLLIGVGAWGLLHVIDESMRDEQSPILADVTLQALDGTPTELRSFVGKPVVLNLWATWCPPCRREMPALSSAQAAHGNVHFVFANQNETADDVRKFTLAQRLELDNLLLDRGALATEYGAPGLPTTLFFDRNGRLQRVHIGELSAPRLADYLSAMDVSEHD